MRSICLLLFTISIFNILLHTSNGQFFVDVEHSYPRLGKKSVGEFDLYNNDYDEIVSREDELNRAKKNDRKLSVDEKRVVAAKVNQLMKLLNQKKAM